MDWIFPGHKLLFALPWTRWSPWRLMLVTPAEWELMLKVWVMSAITLLPGICGAEVPEQPWEWPGHEASWSRRCSPAALLAQEPNAVLQFWELPLPQISSDVMYLWRASQNVFWSNLLSGWWNSCLSLWQTALISQRFLCFSFYLVIIILFSVTLSCNLPGDDISLSTLKPKSGMEGKVIPLIFCQISTFPWQTCCFVTSLSKHH